jgi:hypothetical protein
MVASTYRPTPLHDELHEEAETLLRDLAYVLKLTRRVREEIVAEQEECELAGA